MYKWIGTFAGIIGAVLVASNNGLQLLGYIFFLTGAIAWLYNSVTNRDNAAILQWAFFSLVNTYGLYNYAI